jgi:hypothetical protein
VVGEFTGFGPWEPAVMDQAIPEIPSPSTPASTEPYDGPEVELGPFLDAVEVLGEVVDGKGVKFALVCPWIEEHTGGDRSGTYIGRRAEGGLWFHCNHEHCESRGWREFRDEIRSRARNRRHSVRVERGATTIRLEVSNGRP